MQHTLARFITFAGFCAILAGCSKEAPLHPPLLPDLYELPQGQPYDATILDFKKQYGSYILYQFQPKDVSYLIGLRTADTASPGTPAYVPGALDLFLNTALADYPEAFRKKTMPLRILLASSAGKPLPGGIIAPYEHGIISNKEMLCIGWTNDRLATLTPEEKKNVVAKIHRNYVSRATMGNSITIPRDFIAALPDFFPSNLADDRPEKYTYGLLEAQQTTSYDVHKDFASYVDLVTGHTTAELEAGVLRPSIDTKGLVRKKMGIVVRHLGELGVDLQAIGNRP
ncbi:hypothetical protein ACWKWU_03265 [Chitinophaga lutea]